MEIIIFSILGILIVLTTIFMVKKGMVKITRDTRNKKNPAFFAIWIPILIGLAALLKIIASQM